MDRLPTYEWVDRDNKRTNPYLPIRDNGNGEVDLAEDVEANTSGRMIAMMRRLRVEMNGAVVDAMRERGIEYPLSFGVSVPTIREIALGYAPDHKLARLMWRQDVRELQLAALTVADPEMVTRDEISFWAEGVTNTELAEHLASTLMCRTGVVDEAVEQWLSSKNDLMIYVALLTATRRLAVAGSAPDWDWRAVLNSIVENEGALNSPRRYVWQGMSLFMDRLLHSVPQSREAVQEVIDTAIRGEMPCADYLEVTVSSEVPSGTPN